MPLSTFADRTCADLVNCTQLQFEATAPNKNTTLNMYTSQRVCEDCTSCDAEGLTTTKACGKTFDAEVRMHCVFLLAGIFCNLFCPFPLAFFLALSVAAFSFHGHWPNFYFLSSSWIPSLLCIFFKQCKNCTDCRPGETFEAQPCSLTADRQCLNCNPCQANEYQAAPCNIKANTDCRAIQNCTPKTQFILREFTATSDRGES